MAHRNSNVNKGQAAQAAVAVGLLRAALRRALHRGVCPECGGTLYRQADGLVCRTPECEGVGRAVFRIDCARVEARVRS